MSHESVNLGETASDSQTLECTSCLAITTDLILGTGTSRIVFGNHISPSCDPHLSLDSAKCRRQELEMMRETIDNIVDWSTKQDRSKYVAASDLHNRLWLACEASDRSRFREELKDIAGEMLIPRALVDGASYMKLPNFTYPRLPDHNTESNRSSDKTSNSSVMDLLADLFDCRDMLATSMNNDDAANRVTGPMMVCPKEEWHRGDE